MKSDSEKLADAIEIIRKQSSEITQRDRMIRDLRKENDTAEKIREAIYELAAHSPKPPEWVLRDHGPSGARGTPMVMLSDIHYGEVVRPQEIGGVNKYNSEIAATRLRRFTERTIDLAFNHMGRAKKEYPGIVLCMGGDMVGGDIHEELAVTNDRTTHRAVNDLVDLLAGVVDGFATRFGRVFVPAVVGNHGRSTRKPRMKQRVITNYDWHIYLGLERHFRDTKHVQFLIPEEADARFKVFGHSYLLTHGDSLGVKGGDGIIGALGPILRGSLKVHHSEARLGRDIDTIVMGHWHQYIPMPRIIVNNSVKGHDEFAHLALRAPPSRPSQALWFNHPEHGITAHWEVYLEGQKVGKRARPWVEWEDAAA